MSPQIGAIIGPVILFIRALCILLWLFKAVCSKVSYKEYGLFFVFMLLVASQYIYLGQWLLFDVFFVPVFFGKTMSFERIRKIYLNGYIIAVVFLATLSATGLFSKYVFVRGDGSIRYSLGFLHPNLLGIIILCICYLFLLRDRKFSKVCDYFLLPICAAFLWVVPNSMTSAFLLILTWIAVILMDVRETLKTEKRN